MTGTPLVLLPGLLLDERLYAAQIAALGDVAAILVGNLTAADSIAGMAEAVLAQAPERFALCGLSMGATSRSRSCAGHPDGCTDWHSWIPRPAPMRPRRASGGSA